MTSSVCISPNVSSKISFALCVCYATPVLICIHFWALTYGWQERMCSCLLICKGVFEWGGITTTINILQCPSALQQDFLQMSWRNYTGCLHAECTQQKFTWPSVLNFVCVHIKKVFWLLVLFSGTYLSTIILRCFRTGRLAGTGTSYGSSTHCKWFELLTFQMTNLVAQQFNLQHHPERGNMAKLPVEGAGEPFQLL